MNSDPILNLRQLLTTLKEHGQDVVKIDVLDQILAGVPFDKDHIIATFNAWRADERSRFESDRREMLEFNRFAIDAGRFAIQAAMLVNGGAAVALLTLMGNLSKSDPGDAVLRALVAAASTYSLGVLVASFAAGLAYLTQWSFVHQWNRTGYAFNTVAIALMLTTYVLFYAGTRQALGVFLD